MRRLLEECSHTSGNKIRYGKNKHTVPVGVGNKLIFSLCPPAEATALCDGAFSQTMLTAMSVYLLLQNK